MHSFIAHPPARRTKEKEPPQAKEIPKGRSMQTFFGVMVSWHGVMVSWCHDGISFHANS
jgi:hypothetical protein